MSFLGPNIYCRTASGKYKRDNEMGKGRGSAKDGCGALKCYIGWSSNMCIKIKGNEGASPMDIWGSVFQQREQHYKGPKERYPDGRSYLV